ncbi:MAG: hypothetical protein DMG96_24675 [Acidobacteria bacterium]|nr:MAG: hypothetical protein DMG96_24675 [Acidobacteriota bacterium]
MRGNLFTQLLFWIFTVALWLPLSASPSQQFAPARMNQEAGQRGMNATTEELQNFDDFLDSHPQIAKDLSKNPALANDEKYLQSHPQFAEFLKAHGGVQRELSEHPGRFTTREERWEHAGGNIRRGELRSLDGFLDRNPQIEKDLQKNPDLVNNPQYVNSHPELKRYLEGNPKIAADLKENPKAFIRNEKAYGD